ncbi:MAG: alpha/beta hydrolase [Pseudomonadota bacterium]
MTDIETRYRQLVEDAYSAIDSERGYHDVLEQTHRYLFSEEAKLHADLPRYGARDVALEMHLPQLQALFQQRETEERSDQNYAVLTIRQQDGLTYANAAAEKLFGYPFPCGLDTLPFDRASAQRLSQILRRGVPDLELLLTQIGTEKPISCLATVRQQDADALEVSISFLDWSPNLLDRVGRALGLTQKETDIFAGFANNLSQSEIASLNGRALETVRSQSKSILRKTGCSRMSEVVQIAAGLVYLLDQPNSIGGEPEPNLVWETPKLDMAFLDRPNSRRLAYYTKGSGPQRVLFLHGFLQGPFFTPAFEEALTRAQIQLICPSRPGFGYSTCSPTRASYEQTALEDSIALLDHLGMEQTVLVCHQMSTNHAFRLKAHIPDRIKAMVMVSAGPPIDDVYLKQMDSLTRIAAAAARHTPSILKLINEIGIQSYRRGGGPRAFLQSRYKSSKLDLLTLDDPVMSKPQIDGVFHYIEQGSETLVRDGTSSMADWDDLFIGDSCPQTWLHGADCKALNVDAVREIVQTRVQARYDIIPSTSTNLIHQQPERVVSAIESAISDAG